MSMCCGITVACLVWAAQWRSLDTGLALAEFDAPQKSHCGDSRITVLRIDPARFDLKLISAADLDSVSRTTRQWCRSQGLVAR